VSSPFGRLVLIADPSEAAGGVGEELPRIEQKLRSLDLSYRLVRAESPGDGVGAAREAILAGDRFVAAVGGDRTVHEVANGMLQDGRPLDRESVLGVIPAGAPCDFIRTFGLPSDALGACGHLQGDRLFPIDAGIVSATSGGARAKRVFVNIAEVGLGASIALSTGRLPPRLGRARRFLAFWAALAVFRQTDVVLTGDRRTWEGKIHDIVVANCQYQGEGMRISPRSWPDDGFLDVLVMKGPKSDAFTILPKTYLGEHLPHPNIVEYRSRTLRVEATRALRVHADGELVGTTPAEFEVAPKAIRLKI
jgi:diacylglycerol kinase (ATP)